MPGLRVPRHLRHTFGTRMAAAGVPIRTLQQWMGHRSIATTEHYADYAPSTHEADMVAHAFCTSGSSLASRSAGLRHRSLDAVRWRQQRHFDDDFESEDAALQARELIQPPPDESAAMDSVEIGEVVANA